MDSKEFGNTVSRLIKRGLDIVFALSVLSLMSWLILLIALFHRVFIGPGVFFIQERIGKNGRPFACMKFRTMNDKEDMGNRVSALIVKYEQILRKYKIDELPQFFNVLIGDMSLVGPRPLIEDEIDDYVSIIDNVGERHLERPGITGFSQITIDESQGKTENLVRQKIQGDILYCKNRTLMLDFKILMLTPILVLSQKYFSPETLIEQHEKTYIHN